MVARNEIRAICDEMKMTGDVERGTGRIMELLPKLLKEYDKLERDLASSRSYIRWLDEQYRDTYERIQDALLKVHTGKA